MGRKKDWPKQTNLFRTGTEALKLLRAADELKSNSPRPVSYKSGTSGVKIRSTVLVNGIPLKEAKDISDQLSLAINKLSGYMAVQAKTIMEQLIPTEPEPAQKPEEA